MCICVLARSHPRLAQNADIPTLGVLFPFAVQLYASYENKIKYSSILVHVTRFKSGFAVFIGIVFSSYPSNNPDIYILTL
jgi:hypothetical protein